MKKVTITQLKDNLSALLASAARGQEIIIFDRKKPFAKLVALYSGKLQSEKEDLTSRILRLETEAALSRRKKDSLVQLLKNKRPTSSKSLVSALIEDRDRDL